MALLCCMLCSLAGSCEGCMVVRVERVRQTLTLWFLCDVVMMAMMKAMPACACRTVSSC